MGALKGNSDSNVLGMSELAPLTHARSGDRAGIGSGADERPQYHSGHCPTSLPATAHPERADVAHLDAGREPSGNAHSTA